MSNTQLHHPSEHPIPPTTHHIAPLCFMIVEDSELDAVICQQMIKMDSPAHQIDLFTTGLPALEALQKNTDYDCLLLDMCLPDIDGKELARQMLSIAPDIPIIFLTGKDNNALALQVLADGVEDYLIKGDYNHRSLMRSIRYAMERKRFNIENQRLKQKLAQEQELNAKQAEFVSMVSHEFRTPMAIISSSIQLLRKTLPPDIAQNNEMRLGKMSRAVERLCSLTENTLFFSRFEEGKISFNPQSFNLKAIVESLIQDLEDIYPHHRFLFNGDNLPEYFWGDSALCEQIFINLLSNAAKYSAHHSSVTLSAYSNEQTLSIIIADNGCGMSHADLERLGERFFRAHNSIGTAGTGIGVYLSRSFIQLHGGSLRYESTPETGTKAIVELPITHTDIKEIA